ncbi:MAG: PDZ domain-containing protein [Planctomycetes bacterium]|nr:PDZ domain-containing protein [Planctomycetota bacterium]NUQ33826.1 PDZ domain-containing protein [Planctomycetaceae bacterium]
MHRKYLVRLTLPAVGAAAILLPALAWRDVTGVHAQNSDPLEQRLRTPEGRLEWSGANVKMTDYVEVSLEKLMAVYSTSTGRAVAMQGQMLKGKTTSFFAPATGLETSVESLLRTALATHKLALLSRGAFDEIAPASDGITGAIPVEENELASMNPLAFVATAKHFRHVDAVHARAVLMNMVTRNAGTVLPVSFGANAVLIVDYAESVQRILKCADMLDQPGTTIAGSPTGYLGVSLKEYMESGTIVGAIITEINPGSPAGKVGLKTGDIILEVDGEAVTSVAAAQKKIAARPADDTINLKIKRDATIFNIDAKLGKQEK